MGFLILGNSSRVIRKVIDMKYKCELCLKSDENVKHWTGGCIRYGHIDCIDILERGLRKWIKHKQFLDKVFKERDDRVQGQSPKELLNRKEAKG